VKIENRQQWLVIAVIAIGGLFALDSIVIKPLTSVWRARTDRIAALEQKIARGKGIIGRGQNLRDDWASKQTNTLPVNTSQAEQQMLKAFDSWSQKSRVTITGVTPQWKRESDDYMTLECRVDASGDLQTLTQFLYDIESDPMALKLESVELSAHDNAGQQLTLGLLVSGLVLSHEQQ
jgi:hypothetical protein